MLDMRLNILIVEDNLGDFIIISEYLQEIFSQVNILHATTLMQGIQLAEHEKPDVILLDLTLPDGMGISTFTAINEKAGQVPIIILTGLEDRALALDSLKIGAQDYIVKDDNSPTLLSKSIQYGIERSKIFKDLKTSEKQYKFLFNNNPLPMIACDKTTGEMFMVNEAAILFYGYSETELLTMHIKDLEVAGKKIIGQYKNDEPSAPSDTRHKKKNGDIIDVELNTHDIYLEEKNAVLIAIHNVTERNKAREQLRESENTFRTISENFPNGAVSVLDKDLRIIYTAGKDFHVKNVAANHFHHTHFSDHFHAPEKEKVNENLQVVLQGDTAVFEVKHEGQYYIISAVPLSERNGSINKILIASQNITLQKRNETEKELLIEELTQNNSDLRQFSYITSHNLRAPLSNLLGIIQLIDTSSITDPTTSSLIKNFEECTVQLNETVNDLINVLIIKNNVNAKKEKLDLRVMVDKVIHSIKNNLDEKGVVITTDMDKAFEIRFNHTYLESILLNLLTNAVKYSSPNRRPEINISTKKIKGGVKLYFADNGLGIDLKRYKDRIFGLYQRFHDHADSKGLGLYIVNSQIRVMGGEIDIVSEVDKGTTFIITFKN